MFILETAMQFSLKTVVFVILALLAAFLIVRRTGIMDSQCDRVERELMKPVPLGSRWTVEPVWDSRSWTGDRCSIIAMDQKNRLFALVQAGDGRGDGIMRTVFRYQDIRQVDLTVDGEPISSVSHRVPGSSTVGQHMETDSTAVGKVLKDSRRKVPVLQPVADEESVRDIHLTVHTTDGRMVSLPFGLQELDLARRWCGRLWQAAEGQP